MPAAAEPDASVFRRAAPERLLPLAPALLCFSDPIDARRRRRLSPFRLLPLYL